jgi:hypothetical protein
MKTLQPKDEWLAMYNEVAGELKVLGLDIHYHFAVQSPSGVE